MTTRAQKQARTHTPNQAGNTAPARARRGGWVAWVKGLGVDDAVRGLLLFFAATLPLYYDLAVPEVSGDVRWAATTVFAGLCALLLLGKALWQGEGKFNLRQPLVMWFAFGLAVWAALSLVDALNWLRGIILIKALYAQLVLMVCVYAVATPKFGRQLIWALVAPLFITSWIGIWQFHGLTQDSFAAVVDGSILFSLFKPLIWVGDSICNVLIWALGMNPQVHGMVGFTSNYFMQSAVPGSTFANKNLAGSWTAMMLPLALYLLVTAKRWPGAAAASVLLALGTLFLVYSRARASWVALFCGLMTLAALVILVPGWRRAVWRHLDWTHLLWLMLPVVVVLRWGSAVSPVQGAYAIDRTPAQQVAALAGSSWDEIGGRLAYNLNSLMITKDYWFNGVGLGSFYTIYPKYYDAVVVTPTNSYNVMARPQRTHTDMMQAFDEMGIPGGIFYAGLFIIGIAMALRLGSRRAGRFAGKLIGAGLTSGILAMALFLENQGMLALDAPWNWLLEALLGGVILGLLGWAATDMRALRKSADEYDDIQLMGLLTGIGLLTISVNALMDFPMQLPTAPATAMFFIGVITALYKRQYPAAVAGPKMQVDSNRVGPLLLLVVLGVSWVWAMWDAHKFREGNIILKAAMVRIFSGVNDDTTLALINKAYDVYPYDPRIHEHMAVVYANFAGSEPLPIEERIAKLEWVLKGDPWGANHMINLAGQYLQLIQAKEAQGDLGAARLYLDKTEGLYERLQVVADSSFFTWGIGGMLRLLEGRNEDAASLFQRALAINPQYGPALAGMKILQSRVSGTVSGSQR